MEPYRGEPRNQGPRHRTYAQTERAESRFRVKCSSCLPCEKTRSTAVDRAVTLCDPAYELSTRKVSSVEYVHCNKNDLIYLPDFVICVHAVHAMSLIVVR